MGVISGKGLGTLIKVEGKMNRFDYIQILKNHLLPLIIAGVFVSR